MFINKDGVMLRKSLLILLSYLPISVFGTEFEFSLGTGFQYSGIIGTQFSIKHQDSKYFMSVGLPGYSIGMQTLISDNEYHSAGLSLGEIQGVFDGDSRYGFITYNYHVEGFQNSGWVLGAGLGVYDEESYTPLFSNDRINPSKKAMLTLDVGYKF
jgi:hypothetical protein